MILILRATLFLFVQVKDLADTVAECSRRQLEDVWESVGRNCTQALLEADDQQAEGDKQAKVWAVVPAVALDAILYLMCIIHFAFTFCIHS